MPNYFRESAGAIGLGLIISSCGPIYSGPGLNEVLNGTCQSRTTMAGLYSCVDQFWYQPVSAAGLGSDASATEAMAQGRKLVDDVKQRRTDDRTAMDHWRTLARKYRDDQLAEQERIRDAGASLRKAADNMETSQPILCSTVYGQVTSRTTCY